MATRNAPTQEKSTLCRLLKLYMCPCSLLGNQFGERELLAVLSKPLLGLGEIFFLHERLRHSMHWVHALDKYTSAAMQKPLK